MPTDLEIMIHAKGYLDKLANGVNPLTDEMLPETDVVNQVRISRCLFYVSDVLRQVIERGGLKKAPKAAMTPFALTAEQLARFQPSEQPTFISALAERLNALIEDEHMKRLHYRSIALFLEREGFLIQGTSGQGKMQRIPTDQGKALGITTEERTSQRGTYTAVLYDLNAQRYILAHMEEIAQINGETKSSPSSGRPGQRENVDAETGEVIRY